MARPRKERKEAVEEKDMSLSENKLPKPDEQKPDPEVKEPVIVESKFRIRVLERFIDRFGKIREKDEVYPEPDKEAREILVQKGLGEEVKVE